MIGYTPTPTNFYEDYICHYGTKGMKWGVRKRYRMPSTSDAYKRINAMSDDDYWKKVDAAKLVGKKSSSKTTKAKAAAKEKSGKVSKEKKEKEVSTKPETTREKTGSTFSKQYLTMMQQQLQKDRSQLPKARAKAAELEKKKKRRS